MYISVNDKQGTSIFAKLLTILVIVNVGSHYIKSIAGTDTITYYISYVCWVIYFVFVYFINRSKISAKKYLAVIFLMISFIIGACWGEKYIGTGVAELHRAFFVIIAIICTTNEDLSLYLSSKDVRAVYKGIVFSSIMACVYALLHQYSNWIGLLKGSNINYNSWKLTSFFGQRNIFGECCFIGLCACLYLFRKDKKFFYGIVAIIQYIMIIMTNSRAALLGATITVGLSFLYGKKNKVFYVMFILLLAIVFFYSYDVSGFISTSRATHFVASGEDSGIVRLNIWKSCLSYMLNNKAFVFGFGQGTISYYISRSFGFGSSHSMYIDAMFEGGIVFVLFLIVIVMNTYRYLKSSCDIEYRYTMIANGIAFLAYCSLEAGMSLFKSNFFSLTTTILFVAIPRLYIDDSSLCNGSFLES